MSFFETRLAFRRFWVKEPRYSETILKKSATSIVERVFHKIFFERLDLEGPRDDCSDAIGLSGVHVY